MSLLLLPILLYAILILGIAHHWFWAKSPTSTTTVPSTQVTVIIPFKNESENLPKLVSHLKKQSYSSLLVDYLFVDDHSTDNSVDIISQANFNCISNSGKGKKSALLTGIKVAKGDLLVTLDADCLPGEHWLESIVSAYEAEQSELIICPVKLSPVRSLWDMIQVVEFQSLAASTGGAALGGFPIMCNGANLVFTKNLVDTEEDFFNTSYASGDDMFLLEYAKRKNAKISYLKNAEALVTTTTESWKKFWTQRLRWTSKSAGYTDKAIMLVGAIVLLTNLTLLILPFFSFYLTILAYFLKAFVDCVLLASSASFFKTARYLWIYPFMVPFYPYYVLFTTVGGFFSKKW